MNLDMDKYVKVRMAQAKGARTIAELKELSDIVIENDEELIEVENAVKNGADTVEKVMEATGSSTVCGRCKAGVIPSVIEFKR